MLGTSTNQDSSLHFWNKKPNQIPFHKREVAVARKKKILKELGRRFDLHCISIVNAFFMAKGT